MTLKLRFREGQIAVTEMCKHPGCEMPKGRALGYCNAHYSRHRKGADMDPPIRNVRATDEERFWEKVEKTDTCWVWVGAETMGYGIFRINGGNQVAHRVSYTWAFGKIPEGVQLDHMCHNRSCVRPDHLRFADHALNGQNRSSANRNSKSGIRGVYWNKDRRGWFAAITLDREVIREGPFDCKYEAEEAVQQLRREHMPYSLMDYKEDTNELRYI